MPLRAAGLGLWQQHVRHCTITCCSCTSRTRPPSSLAVQANEPQRAEQLRFAIERLGPAYVKVAQVRGAWGKGGKRGGGGRSARDVTGGRRPSVCVLGKGGWGLQGVGVRARATGAGAPALSADFLCNAPPPRSRPAQLPASLDTPPPWLWGATSPCAPLLLLLPQPRACATTPACRALPRPPFPAPPPHPPQAMSTRVDLLTPAYFEQIQLLQDRVPPFPCDVALAQMEKVGGWRGGWRGQVGGQVPGGNGREWLGWLGGRPV